MLNSLLNVVQLLLIVAVLSGCTHTAESEQQSVASAAAPDTTSRSSESKDAESPAAGHTDECSCGSSHTEKDWPRLYGPSEDSSTCESELVLDWSAAGPPVLWTKRIGTGYSAPVTQGTSLVLQHRIAEHEIVSCIDVRDGQIVWERRDPTTFECDYAAYSDGPYSTPVIHGESVIVQSAEGVLRRISMHDGSEHWSRHLSLEYQVPKYGYGVGHSPVIAGRMIVVNAGGAAPDSGVVALDFETGATVWSSVDLSETRLTGSHAMPVMARIQNRDVCVVLSGDRLSCLDTESGAVLWEFAVSTHSRDTPNATTPLVAGDRILVSSFRADTFCVNAPAGNEASIAWRKPRSLGSVFNPLTCRGDYVLGWHSFDKSLRAIALQTGEVLWKKKTVFERGNHIDTGEHLIVLGELGHLGVIACNADGAEIVCATAEPVLDGPCFTMPALSNGLLFVRDEKQLICFDLRPTTRRSRPRTGR